MCASTAGGGNRGSRASRLLRRAELQGALALALLILLFLRTPLARYAQVHYSPADLTQDFLLTKVEPYHAPGNRLLSDTVTQMQPWLHFNREELRRGRFPLWNPLNGCGAPHFANYQSAVLSPFSLPYYLLGFKAALLVGSFAKLFALGYATFLFLLRIGLVRVAALLGGCAFAFCGHNVLLLGLPHPGSLVALPAGLLFAEIAFQRFERAEREPRRARLLGPLAALCLVLCAGLLAGNPEPFYFGALVLGTYCAARLAVLLRATLRCGGSPTSVLRLAAQLLLSAAIAAALAAPQLLGFLEYLRESRLYDERNNVQAPLDLSLWPLAFFPDLLGNPASGYYPAPGLPPPNYELANMGYVGSAALLLAALALPFALRRRQTLFFLGAALAWWIYAHDLFGSWRWFARIPSVDLAPMNRSHGIWAFFVAVLAALALHELQTRPARRALLAGALSAAAALAALFFFESGAERLIERFADAVRGGSEHFEPYVPEHMRHFRALFLLAAGSTTLLWAARSPKVRSAAGLAFVALVYAQTGHHHRDYNTVSEDRFFFPVTPAIAALQEEVGARRLAILGADQMPADTNLFYGLQTIANYDGMWVRDYDHLYRDFFGESDNWRPVLSASRRALQLFGVEYVLAKWGWTGMRTGLGNLTRRQGRDHLPRPIRAESPLSQTFLCRRPDLSSVAVQLSANLHSPACTVRIRVLREEDGRVLCERTLASEEVRSSIHARGHLPFPGEPRTSEPSRPVVLEFPPQADSEGRTYRIVLDVPEGRRNTTILAWLARERGYADGEAREGELPLGSELLFDFAFAQEALEPVRAVEEFVLYRLPGALGTYALVDQALEARSEDEAAGFLGMPAFDPRRIVVIGPTKRGAQEARAGGDYALYQREGSERHYVRTADHAAFVHVPGNVSTMQKRFGWDRVEVLTEEQFARALVIENDPAAARRAEVEQAAPLPEPTGTLELLMDGPTRAELRVERPRAGYLLVLKARYPGWKARVNGEPRELLRANYAFSAILLEAGSSAVELVYEPDSLRLGLWIALLGALAALTSILLSRRWNAA